MKQIKLLWLLLAGMLFIVSCEEEEEEDLLGNWVELSDFEGFPRSNAISFAIGEFGFVGTGFNGEEDEYYRDFWRYNVSQNFWQRIDTFPGVARSAAVAFSLDGKGYVGLGYDGDDELNDFYVYDSKSGSWSQIADFGGSARRNAVAFGLNGKGYVGTGNDGNTLKDFWEYDPDTDSWVQIPSIGGSKRENAIAMVINDVAYVGSGSDNGAIEVDWWRFDPGLLPDFPWIEMQDLDEEDDYAIAREGGTTFTMNGLGYVVLGQRSTNTSSIWEYDPSTDFWIEKTAFEGATRIDPVGFAIQQRGFIATGRASSIYFDDIWEFRPFDEEDEDD